MLEVDVSTQPLIIRQTTVNTMRCTAYCTAGSYRLPSLFRFLKDRYSTNLYRDAIHSVYGNENKNVFFFSYGVFVCWGLLEEEELDLIEKLKSFEVEPNTKYETENYDFGYGEVESIQRDELILTSKDAFKKLALSYGLAQSVKLSLFEETIEQTIARSKHLPEDLARKGKIFLSRKEISQKIGELFIDRSSVNLHSDILDEPDFFWDYPEHHPIYRSISKCLDIRPRAEVLNTRLTILGDLLEILSDQLNHQHSSILEWTIIWLIVIEVILALLKDLFHLI